MDEKPILFNTEMVKAILEGRKTVTRRVIKPRYRDDECGWTVCINSYTHLVDDVAYTDGDGACTRSMKPPYQVGDILYVRETWNRGFMESSDAEGDNSVWFEECHEAEGYCAAISHYIYRADFTPNEEFEYGVEVKDGVYKMNWKPSIHMPKEAARIFLKVTDVRVERLQDMTEDDVCSEGAENLICSCEHIDYSVVPPEPCFNTCNACKDCIIDHSYQELFGRQIWDSTIKKNDLDRYGWEANPWVWVIEFERMEKENG